MQIDFHHAVTYVAGRLAGKDHAKADIIAYAAQYVPLLKANAGAG